MRHAANALTNNANTLSTAFDSAEAGNAYVKEHELTAGHRSATNIERYADRARAMGNDTAAERYAKLAADRRGPLNAFLEHPKIGAGAQIAGGVLGGLSVVSGINELAHHQYSQGGLDAGSGALGVASALPEEALVGALGETAAGALGPAGLAAGLIATGNGVTQNWGLWGKNKDGSNKDSVQWTVDNTKHTFEDIKKATGGGVLGDIAGGIAGADVGIASGVAAAGADLAGGVVGVGQGAWNLAKDVGGGIGAVERGVGDVESGAAHAVGHAVSSLFGW